MSAAKKLAKLVEQPIHGEKLKKEFRRLATKVMKELVAAIGLEKGTYDIKYNAGGIAVSGEVWLFAEKFFVEFSQTSLGSMFMYRTCEKRGDSGSLPKHRNQWMHYRVLEDMPLAAETIARNVGLRETAKT